ncbi:MAG TPA: hypothetical protein HA283_03680 [Nanoarchaeota archaeon]|nr:hypothetical protein [Nanoarchaeota archaeon]HIH63371.1 hypothetical protein [Nanoarchaeota archaeon]HIJ09748.1 hypothetical protein [Nanoarchaeota archaeon]
MQKSNQRIQLEKKIINAHQDSIQIAMNMINKEFNGDFDKALADESFVFRIQNKVKPIWSVYRQGYQELELLEKEEGYLAMAECTKVLDEISGYLPELKKQVCHYPCSGIDFYWGRIFQRTIFQDIAFSQDEMPNMWWDPEMYSFQKRQEIIGNLKSQKIIPEQAILEFIVSDAETFKSGNQFNNLSTTLLIKGGHDFLGHIQSRFKNHPVKYGAIIIVNPSNPLKEIESMLEYNNYLKKISLKGTDWLIPYSMELRDIHIFLKKQFK